MRKTIETDRIILRRWKSKDRVPFAELNSDPVVMEHFLKVLTPVESNVMIKRIEEHFERHGFGLWAMERKEDAAFMGFTGLAIPPFEAKFTPCVEIGWRMHQAFWGQGYVTEAAREVVKLAFGELGLRELVSFTVPANTRSRAVMERLGMTRDPRDDFDHPKIPEGHPLRRHVLYRLK
jgi:ribosomal-protein-alanine N-acetyltransferase